MIFTHNATTLPRPAVDDVTIREATPTDDVALDRLAQLDSARVPEGRVIVAGANGGLLAAMPVAGGAAIADPFRPTAAIVGLLDLRAS